MNKAQKFLQDKAQQRARDLAKEAGRPVEEKMPLTWQMGFDLPNKNVWVIFQCGGQMLRQDYHIEGAKEIGNGFLDAVTKLEKAIMDQNPTPTPEPAND